jgi:hypothetical protein
MSLSSRRLHTFFFVNECLGIFICNFFSLKYIPQSNLSVVSYSLLLVNMSNDTDVIPTSTTMTTTTIASVVETKSKGSEVDLRGTWSTLVPLPQTFSMNLTKWAHVNIAEDHIWRSPWEPHVIKGDIVTNHEVNVLLNIKIEPTNAFADSIRKQWQGGAFRIKFGPLDTFTKEVKDGQSYNVLMMPVFVLDVNNVKVDVPLIQLQRLVGRLCVAPHQPPLKWHHDTYTPHVTVAFIKPEYIQNYLGISLSSEMDSVFSTVNVDRMIVKKFQDKTWPSISIPLASDL